MSLLSQGNFDIVLRKLLCVESFCESPSMVIFLHRTANDIQVKAVWISCPPVSNLNIIHPKRGNWKMFKGAQCSLYEEGEVYYSNRLVFLKNRER